MVAAVARTVPRLTSRQHGSPRSCAGCRRGGPSDAAVPPTSAVSEDRRDLGSTSLTAVLLTPVFVVIAFAAFQAAMWSHARTEARAVARDVAVLVAQRGEDADLIARSAERNLDEGVNIDAADVTISNDGTIVVVRVTATAPGIIRGTSAPVDVTEALPVEGFRP